MRRTSLLLIVSAMALAAFYLGCQQMRAKCLECGKVVKVTTLRGIHFDFNKYQIRPDGVPILNEDVKMLKDDPSLDIMIEGHCDIVGSDEYNQKLSEKRAETVYNYFLGNGIPASRMKMVGYGRSRPIVPNDTPANRAINRRVEIKIIKARP